MVVDDASTLDPGGAKVELGWSRDGGLRGFDTAVGYGPIGNLEAEISFARARDHGIEPNRTLEALGGALKWVPLQSPRGFSAGIKYEYGRERIVGAGIGHVHGATALLTRTFEPGSLLHLNLGREWTRADGATDAVSTWGVGADFPVAAGLRLTLETFGANRRGPSRQIGVRCEIQEGLKVSGAVGRGNDGTLANAGIAWEF